MLNHETGQMDWGSTAYHSLYFNPDNLLDPMTHRGRELITEGSTSTDSDDISFPNADGPAWPLFLIAALIICGFFLSPFSS